MRFLWHLTQAGFVGLVGGTAWSWIVAALFGEPDELDLVEEDFWDRYEVGPCEWIP